MNTYELNRRYWEISSENPGKLKPNHASLYFYIINLNNKLGWKDKFGFPTLFAMEGTNIRSRHTINKTLKELEDFGLIKIVEDSKNQHTAKIVALIKTYKAHNKAHNKASEWHNTRRVNGTSTIDKPLKTIKQETYKTINIEFGVFWDSYDHKVGSKSKAKKKWENLKDGEREKIIKHIPIYKKNTPDKTYRKQPVTYLNQRVWESEGEWQVKKETNGKYIPGQNKMPWV